MPANRVLNVVLGLLAIVVLPIHVIANAVLTIGVSITFGLLLLPLSVLWACLFFPMLGLSWVCNKVPSLRDPIGIVFIPWVVVAQTFATMVPSMGEMDSRVSKIMACDVWPFTWEFLQVQFRKLDYFSDDPGAIALREIGEREFYRSPLKDRVLRLVVTGCPLDE